MPYSSAVKWGVVIAALGFVFQSLSGVLMGGISETSQNRDSRACRHFPRTLQLAAAGISFYAGGTFLHFLFYIHPRGAVQLCIVYASVRRQIPFRLVFHAKALVRTLKESWPMAVSAILVLVYFKGDTLL